jgi:hypothetical protein
MARRKKPEKPMTLREINPEMADRIERYRGQIHRMPTMRELELAMAEHARFVGEVNDLVTGMLASWEHPVRTLDGGKQTTPPARPKLRLIRGGR